MGKPKPPPGPRRLNINISAEVDATLRRAAARDHVREADWIREAIAAKAARGEAIESMTELPALRNRVARIEHRLGLE